MWNQGVAPPVVFHGPGIPCCCPRATAASYEPAHHSPKLLNEVELQPLLASGKLLSGALDFPGNPLTPPQQLALSEAMANNISYDSEAAHDTLFLVGVTINPEGRVKHTPAPAHPLAGEAEAGHASSLPVLFQTHLTLPKAFHRIRTILSPVIDTTVIATSSNATHGMERKIRGTV